MSLRRIATLATAVLGLAAGTALAQLQPGKDYTLLKPPQASEAGKIEVIEFFSYACGHCYKLEPFLEAWAKKLPADVVFKRVPGAGSDAWSQLAVLYFSLEAMGKLESHQKKVFDAMHAENVNLANPKIREGWLAKNGIDAAQYVAVEKSFTVQSKLSRAKQLMGDYKVDGVPMLVVNGKYVTSNAHAGGPERVVPVLEGLIAMARKESGLEAAAKGAAPAKPAAKPAAAQK